MNGTNGMNRSFVPAHHLLFCLRGKPFVAAITCEENDSRRLSELWQSRVSCSRLQTGSLQLLLHHLL